MNIAELLLYIVWGTGGIVIVFTLFRDYIFPRKHIKCGTKGRYNGMSGSKYQQYWCKNCEETFWVHHNVFNKENK